MDEIIKLISTYGLAIVISGLVLYFAIQFAHVFLEEYKQKRGIQHHDELHDIRAQVSSVINILLDRVLLKTRSDRVYVFEFHNGITSMGGLPFTKMSNTYEALNEGTASELHARENMPMSLYSSFMDGITCNDYIGLDIDDRRDAYSKLIYETLVTRKVKVTLRAKITDINKRIIGYVGLDYCREKPSDETLAQSIGILLDTATELGALLTVHNKKARF